VGSSRLNLAGSSESAIAAHSDALYRRILGDFNVYGRTIPLRVSGGSIIRLQPPWPAPLRRAGESPGRRAGEHP
jgi:hypothetical protein